MTPPPGNNVVSESDRWNVAFRREFAGLEARATFPDRFPRDRNDAKIGRWVGFILARESRVSADRSNSLKDLFLDGQLNAEYSCPRCAHRESHPFPPQLQYRYNPALRRGEVCATQAPRRACAKCARTSVKPSASLAEVEAALAQLAKEIATRHYDRRKADSGSEAKKKHVPQQQQPARFRKRSLRDDDGWEMTVTEVLQKPKFKHTCDRLRIPWTLLLSPDESEAVETASQYPKKLVTCSKSVTLWSTKMTKTTLKISPSKDENKSSYSSYPPKTDGSIWEQKAKERMANEYNNNGPRPKAAGAPSQLSEPMPKASAKLSGSPVEEPSPTSDTWQHVSYKARERKATSAPCLGGGSQTESESHVRYACYQTGKKATDQIQQNSRVLNGQKVSSDKEQQKAKAANLEKGQKSKWSAHRLRRLAASSSDEEDNLNGRKEIKLKDFVKPARIDAKARRRMFQKDEEDEERRRRRESSFDSSRGLGDDYIWDLDHEGASLDEHRLYDLLCKESNDSKRQQLYSRFTPWLPPGCYPLCGSPDLLEGDMPLHLNQGIEDDDYSLESSDSERNRSVVDFLFESPADESGAAANHVGHVESRASAAGERDASSDDSNAADSSPLQFLDPDALAEFLQSVCAGIPISSFLLLSVTVFVFCMVLRFDGRA